MLNFILYTIFIIFIANSCSWLSNDTLLIALMLGLVGLFIYKRRKIDITIIYILCFWLLINIISYFINESNSFPYLTFSSVTMRMVMPYLIMKIIGKGFFNDLQNYLFVLCLISFPFYIIELISPDYIHSLAPYLNFMTKDEQVDAGGFYIFIYMHSGWAQKMYDTIIRNSGFMWEPGAFSAILTFMIVYQLFKDHFKISIKILFLALCLLTTFSTSGFLALFSITFLYFFYNKNFYWRYRFLIPILLIPILFFGVSLYEKADFMEAKIERYIDEGTKVTKWEYKENSMMRVNRLAYMQIAIESSFHNPFGNGIILNKYLVQKYKNARGPNSLAEILIRWGWLGLIGVFICLYNFKVEERKAGLLLLIPFSLVLFSNPFSFRYLLLSVIYSVISRHKDSEYDPTNEFDYTY